MMSNKRRACCCFCLLKPSKESQSIKRHTGDLGEEKMCFLICLLLLLFAWRDCNKSHCMPKGALGDNYLKHGRLYTAVAPGESLPSDTQAASSLVSCPWVIGASPPPLNIRLFVFSLLNIKALCPWSLEGDEWHLSPFVSIDRMHPQPHTPSHLAVIT